MVTNKEAIVPLAGVVAGMMASSIASANAQSAPCKLTSQALSALAGLAKYTPGGYISLWRHGRHITTSALNKVNKLVKLVCLLC
ncbi:hypothetical protein V8C86DRAFT_2965465 [Haematococcus lacustris]